MESHIFKRRYGLIKVERDKKPMEKTIIYIDMDGVLCDYYGAYKMAMKNDPEIKYPQSQYGFFRNLKPLPNALRSVEYLMQQRIFDVYILTAPSINNPLCYSEKREWVEKHLGMELVKRLIISPNKGLNKGQYLIDDHKDGRGQEHFEGKLIHFGWDEFLNWDGVIDYFKEKYILSTG